MMTEKLYMTELIKAVDAMFDEGLIEEVRKLKERGIGRDATSMQAIGYKEVLDYFDGLCTLDYLRENIKRITQDIFFKKTDNVV